MKNYFIIFSLCLGMALHAAENQAISIRLASLKESSEYCSKLSLTNNLYASAYLGAAAVVAPGRICFCIGGLAHLAAARITDRRSKKAFEEYKKLYPRGEHATQAEVTAELQAIEKAAMYYTLIASSGTLGVAGCGLGACVAASTGITPAPFLVGIALSHCCSSCANHRVMQFSRERDTMCLRSEYPHREDMER